MTTLRISTPEDYPALAHITTAAFPEYPASPEDFAFADVHRDPKCLHARWVSVREGQIVGCGDYSQRPGMYHPRKFHVDVTVLPEHQAQGIGRTLYNQVMQALTAYDPLSVRALAREDMTRSVRFLEDQGFTVEMRSWESRLDVAPFDPAPYADAEAKMQKMGIKIKTLAELEHRPGHWQKHYDLSTELNIDVPSPEPRTVLDKDFWRQRLADNPDLIRDAYFIALDGEEYIGLSVLWNSRSSDDLTTGLTAVRRTYRRQGIALALKLRAIAWAKANRKPRIKTWNEANNRGMLGINERLGYVKQPLWLDFVKILKEDHP